MPKVDKNPIFRSTGKYGEKVPQEPEGGVVPPTKAASAPPLPPKQTKVDKRVYREKMGPPPDEPDSGSAMAKGGMAKGGKAESNYSGYIPSFEEDPEALRRAQARGIRKIFDADYENARTKYETYRGKKDPSSAEMSKQLGAADEEAVKLMKRRHHDADDEQTREYKRFSRQQEETGKAARGAGAGRGVVNPPFTPAEEGMRKGGAVKKYAAGGSASSRADGCAMRGKTRGKVY